MDQLVVHTCSRENHWRKVCRASKFNKKQRKTHSGCARHSKTPKGKTEWLRAEKHLHNIEVHDEIADGFEASFPDQLYFHTLSTDEITKEDTQNKPS